MCLKNYDDRRKFPFVHVIIIYVQTIYCSKLCDNSIDSTECLFVKKNDKHDNTLLPSWFNMFDLVPRSTIRCIRCQKVPM